MFEDMTDPPAKLYAKFGSYTGLRPIKGKPGAQDGSLNIIFMQFKLFPKGIGKESKGKESHIKFDITRRMESLSKFFENGKEIEKTRVSMSWPSQVEVPNDDAIPPPGWEALDDESKEPTDDDHMYSFDAPGIDFGFTRRIPALANCNKITFQGNFAEFVRVDVGNKPIKPAGDVLAGSRSSDYFYWHASHTLEKKSGAWKRTTGSKKEVKDINDIGEGYIDVTK